MKPKYIETAEYIQEGDKLTRIVRNGDFIYYFVEDKDIWDGFKIEVQNEDQDG